LRLEISDMAEHCFNLQLYLRYSWTFQLELTHPTLYEDMTINMCISAVKSRSDQEVLYDYKTDLQGISIYHIYVDKVV